MLEDGDDPTWASVDTGCYDNIDTIDNRLIWTARLGTSQYATAATIAPRRARL